MHASYDCLGRQATAGGSLYAGEDRQYKLTVGAATDQVSWILDAAPFSEMRMASGTP